MEKEVLKIKSGESVELDIWGKKIEIQAEEEKEIKTTEHTREVFWQFAEKMAQIIPTLKGENGKDGKDGKDGVEWKAGTPGRDGRDGKDGKNGENGKSAYEQAVENGFTGTLEEWLASLKWEDGKDGKNWRDGKDGKDGRDGRPGDPGPRGPGVIGPAGASAYEIAVKNGFVGTEQEWLQENENLIIAYSISL